MDSVGLSSNWKKLQATLPKDSNHGKVAQSHTSKSPHQNALKRKRFNSSREGRPAVAKAQHYTPQPSKKRFKSSIGMTEAQLATEVQKPTEPSILKTANNDKEIRLQDSVNGGLNTSIEVGKYIALDCEMVGIGPDPDYNSVLARISVVNFHGDCIYDSFVKPVEKVTDWRTHVSGVTPAHMIEARDMKDVQRDVADLIKGRIVVGHSVRKDFEVLLLSHPTRDIRDTARHPPYRKLAGGGSPKLKILASDLLGLDIQTGEHSSIEDARATMFLFKRDKDAFEREHAKKWPTKVVAVKTQPEGDKRTTPKKKKKKKK